ncbi:hypothetical protein cyc_01744 [Cyclospora cayetanensis]|uniref:Transmembrane protein n=1 Tax=Cyclospora cayetanensis TaxID=88456 RepID=A0A1D3CS39_9EIME|nr:hypothetical protein cyc_01744 [Cyclospora cayetanensis]
MRSFVLAGGLLLLAFPCTVQPATSSVSQITAPGSEAHKKGDSSAGGLEEIDIGSAQGDESLSVAMRFREQSGDDGTPERGPSVNQWIKDSLTDSTTQKKAAIEQSQPRGVSEVELPTNQGPFVLIGGSEVDGVSPEKVNSSKHPRSSVAHDSQHLLKEPNLVSRRRRRESESSRSKSSKEPLWTSTDEEESESWTGQRVRIRETESAPRRHKSSNSKSSKKKEQLQVLRTVQLLNILLKEQNSHVPADSGSRERAIDPAKLAVSYENALNKMLTCTIFGVCPVTRQVETRKGVFYRWLHIHQVEGTDDSKGEEGLSWAAALILAIPPSILAILLAHHISKRHAEQRWPKDGSEEALGKGRYSTIARDADVDSDADSSFDDEFMRPEGEAESFAEYRLDRPIFSRRPNRFPNGRFPSRRGTWVPKYENRQPGLYRRRRDTLSYRPTFGEAFDEAYIDPPFGSYADRYAAAKPLAHEFTEPEELDGHSWAAVLDGNRQSAQEFSMHGGL